MYPSSHLASNRLSSQPNSPSAGAGGSSALRRPPSSGNSSLPLSSSTQPLTPAYATSSSAAAAAAGQRPTSSGIGGAGVGTLRAASAGIGSRLPNPSSTATSSFGAVGSSGHAASAARSGALTSDQQQSGGGSVGAGARGGGSLGSSLAPGSHLQHPPSPLGRGLGGAGAGFSAGGTPSAASSPASPAAGASSAVHNSGTQSMLRSLRPGSSGGSLGASTTHSTYGAGLSSGGQPMRTVSSAVAGRPATAGLGAVGGVAGGASGAASGAGGMHPQLRLSGGAGVSAAGAGRIGGGAAGGGGGGGGSAPAFSCSVLASTSRSSNKPLHLHVGSGCTQGMRPTMEDEHINLINAKTVDGNPLSLFAVLDGHCGRRVAELGSQMLPEALFTHPMIGQNNAQAFVEAIMQIDRQIFQAIRNQDGGCTLITALVHKRMLFVANLGDARAVLCDSGQAVPMSIDHKPTDPAEQARIVRCGGFVHFGRVSGCLAVSRALGDFEFKVSMGRFVQKEFQVSNVADIRQINLTDGTRFLIIACDGLWDVMTNEDAVLWVTEYLAKHESALIRDPNTTLNRAGQALAEAAVSRGSTDNVSCTILLFHTPGGGGGGGGPTASNTAG